MLAKFARAAVALASEIAPRAVGRAVFWRCCRTAPPANMSDNALIAKAEQRLAAARRIDVVIEDLTVAAFLFDRNDGTAPRGTIALVHGWTGRAAFMTAFVKPLTANGYSVVAVDLPGHGHSTGRLLHVPLAVRTLAAVHAQTGPWHGIVGHSFGGLVAMAFASGAVPHVPRVAVERLALIAAPNDALFIFEFLGRMFGLGRRAQKAMNDEVIPVAGAPIETFDGVAMIRRSGATALVIHAPDDREVPFSCAQALAQATDLVTLIEAPGMGHRRILYAPAVVEAVAAFMAGRPAASRAIA